MLGAMLVSAITVSKEAAPLVIAMVMGVPAAFVIYLMARQMSRFAASGRQFAEQFSALLPWQPGSFEDLCWDGSYSRTSGPFRTRLRFALNSQREMRKEADSDDIDIDKLSPGLASFELRTVGLPVPLMTFRRLATFRTSEHAVELSIRFRFPGFAVREAKVSIDGQAVGDFECGDKEVAARNSSGEVVGTWQTGRRLLDILDPGTDPSRAPLRIRGRQIAAVLAPTVAAWAHSMRVSGGTLCREVASPLANHERQWLLATVALSTYCLGVSRGFKTK